MAANFDTQKPSDYDWSAAGGHYRSDDPQAIARAVQGAVPPRRKSRVCPLPPDLPRLPLREGKSPPTRPE